MTCLDSLYTQIALTTLQGMVAAFFLAGRVDWNTVKKENITVAVTDLRGTGYGFIMAFSFLLVSLLIDRFIYQLIGLPIFALSAQGILAFASGVCVFSIRNRFRGPNNNSEE